MSSAPRAAAPPSFAALRHRGFRAFFAFQAMTMMADSIEHVISYWMMWDKFHSPTLGGFAVVSHWLPFLFFSVWAGGLADRFDPRRVMQIGMALFMLASLAWGVLFATDSLEMWHAAVLLTLHGFAGVFWSPAGQLLIHDIVGPEELPSAVRLTATARWLGLLAGPALGGALMLWPGPIAGICVNALFYLPLALWLCKAPYGPKFRHGRTAPPRPVRGMADIREAIAAIASNRTIVSMTVLAGGASLFVGNAYQAQMPAFAHDLAAGDAGLIYSMLLGADAAGALLAGVVLESRGLLPPHPRTAFILAMLWCCALAGFALVGSYVVALALLFVAGFLELSFNAMAQALVQLEAPAAMRGRVIGLFSMSALGLRAFSGVTVGLLGAAVGVHASLAASALLLLAVSGVMLGFVLRPTR